MILSLAGVLLASILLLCFFNIRLGAALYLAYALLVPINDITLGPLHLGENLVKFALVAALFFDFKVRHHYKFSWKLLMPLVWYYVIELFLIPFQSETSFGWMVNSWRVDIMRTMFGAFVVYNVMTVYPDSKKLFRNSLLISILIAGVYGLFLTTTGGINPYILEIVSETGSNLDEESLTEYFSDDNRLFGRISSVFRHPMSFGLFIGLAFVYIWSVRKRIHKWIFFPLLVILGLDSLFCGVRSCIGGLVVAVAYYLIFSKNLKIGIAALIIGLVGYNIVLQLPEVSDYLGSITDVHGTKSDVGGSSIEMRLDQLNGCFKEIQNCPFVGKGYGWVAYYKANFGDHPVILAFESLIFVVLCNNGFLGIIIWIFLALSIYKNNHKYLSSASVVADSLLIFYIAYACITGEYGYMPYFLLFYICLAMESQPESVEVSKKNTKKQVAVNTFQ